jgi:HK97 family phage major capsid protein
MQGETLWGKRVVVTEAMDAGTALVGAFGTAAQVFRRGGLTVEASNSHSDYFRKNLTAVRAEERLALAVYRPQAFATADVTAT